MDTLVLPTRIQLSKLDRGLEREKYEKEEELLFKSSTTASQLMEILPVLHFIFRSKFMWTHYRTLGALIVVVLSCLCPSTLQAQQHKSI